VREPVARLRRPLVLGAIAGALAIAAVVMCVATRPSAPARARLLGDAGAGAAVAGPGVARPGRGSETLAGTVVDASGTAVGDVAITATLELGPGDQSRAPAAGAADEVVAYAGADGVFELQGLEPGRHRLRVEGGDIFTAEVRFVPVPSDGVRIAVARRVEVVGTVLDGGRPVPGAHVTIDGESLDGRLETTTDRLGGFGFDALPEGTYRVWAHESDLASRAVRAPRLGAGPFPPVALILEPATIVVGRIVDRATGIGIEAAVSLEPVSDTAGDATEAPRFGRSNRDGVFRIEGVPHGRWLVDGWAPGWRSTGALEVVAGRGTPEVELVAGAIIEGRVVDGRGRPVRDAVVRAVGEGAMGRGLEVSADVEADRLRRFSGFAPAGGRAQVLAAATATPSSDFTADPRFVPRGELGVLLGPIPFPPPPGGSTLRQATIVDVPVAPGAASAGAPAPLPVDPAYAARFVTDADGRFRISGLDGGSWQVIAIAPGMAEGKSKRLSLAPGKVAGDVEIVLSAGTFLVGTVTSARGGPLVGATVTAAPRGARSERERAIAVTDGDGRYRIGPLLGELVLTVTAWGHADGRAEVELAPGEAELPGERVQDFALAPADAILRGRVVDPDHLPVRGASLVVDAGAARGRRARSDADGWFEIAAVPAGEATLAIEHPEFPRQRATIDTTGDATVTLAWGGAIAGLVLDHHTGDPLAGLAVTVDGSGGRVEVASGPRGELTAGPLLAGTYTVRISVPGYLAVEREVEVPAAKRAGEVTVRDVRLELERGALLAGVVRDRYGSRLPGARIVVSRDGGAPVEGRSDSEGEFRLRDVPTGEVTVRAEKGAMRGSKALTLRPGDEVLTFVIDLD